MRSNYSTRLMDDNTCQINFNLLEIQAITIFNDFFYSSCFSFLKLVDFYSSFYYY